RARGWLRSNEAGRGHGDFVVARLLKNDALVEENGNADGSVFEFLGREIVVAAGATRAEPAIGWSDVHLLRHVAVACGVNVASADAGGEDKFQCYGIVERELRSAVLGFKASFGAIDLSDDRGFLSKGRQAGDGKRHSSETPIGSGHAAPFSRAVLGLNDSDAIACWWSRQPAGELPMSQAESCRKTKFRMH